jgi:predicted DNA-binding transcriptional regulator YafY
MRYDKTRKSLELARALASSAEGLTLNEMCRVTGCERRTVERMRDTIRDVFPQMEEIADHPTKRFHIPKGLDGFFQDPTAEELSDRGVVVTELRDAGATARARSLAELEKKIRAAMHHGRRRMTETDVEALLRAERIAVQAGPRPAEDPAVSLILRQALLGMKMLRFIYHGGSRPGTSRDVVPFGIIFGRMNYLIGADTGTTKAKSRRGAAEQFEVKRQFCDPVGATLSRRRDLRTDASRREYFAIGEAFAADPRSHQCAT